MIKTSKQLKDLVGNRAHGDSAKSMLFLRNYAMERFLERLSASKYRNCFILKGGMLISAMVGIDSRATMDIDTTLRNYPLNCESAEQIVRQIADVEIDDKISFVIKKTEEIMEDSEYQGVRLSLDAYLDKTRIPLKLDISTGDVITPCEISFSYQLMFENRTIPLLAYPPETVLAEKLETILSRGEANTRLRDFYDVYILQREDFVVTPDALRYALLATCRKRGHEDLLHTYASILNEVRQSGAMRAQWMKYQTDFDYAAGITWDTVLDTVETLSCPFFLSVSCLSEKTPPTLYPYSEGFCTKLFSKKFALTFSCTTFAAFVRKKYGCRKKPLITDRDKNRSFDSLLSKNSEIISPFKTSPYLIRH